MPVVLAGHSSSVSTKLMQYPRGDWYFTEKKAAAPTHLFLVCSGPNLSKLSSQLLWLLSTAAHSSPGTVFHTWPEPLAHAVHSSPGACLAGSFSSLFSPLSLTLGLTPQANLTLSMLLDLGSGFHASWFSIDARRWVTSHALLRAYHRRPMLPALCLGTEVPRQKNNIYCSSVCYSWRGLPGVQECLKLLP